MALDRAFGDKPLPTSNRGSVGNQLFRLPPPRLYLPTEVSAKESAQVPKPKAAL